MNQPAAIFLFPGQGSQEIGMGADFYREYDVVRETFDMASEIADINIARLCFKGPMEELILTRNLQPAMTAVSLAGLRILQKEHLAPMAAAGHSLGEYSALCAAGVLTPEAAFKLVCKRGALMDREAGRHQGGMHALVGLFLEDVQKLVDHVAQQEVVAVANHNAEKQVVITGTSQGVEKVAALAAGKGGKAIALSVSGAWHSELMQVAQDEFADDLADHSFHAPDCPVVLNVTGAPETDPDQIKAVMARQLCSPVRWYDSMLAMAEMTPRLFVEVGPGKVLSGLMRRTLPKEKSIPVMAMNDMRSLDAIMQKVG